MNTPNFIATGLDIDAPIDLVWSIMLDLQKYREWNPFIIDVENAPREPRPGSRIGLKVRWPNGSTTLSWETISQVLPPSGLDGRRTSALLVYDYAAGLAKAGLVIASRRQILTQERGQPTHYRTEETFHGPLACFVPIGKVLDGFERHAAALKQRAETLVKADRGAELKSA